MDEDKAYRNLAAAIALQAVKDYREAILDNDSRMLSSCERFFRSQWCNYLTRFDCSNLAEKLKTETFEFKAQAEKIFKEKSKKNDTETNKKAFKCPSCGEWVAVRYCWISRKYRTKGYIAECKSCELTYKRKI